jgi:hypothetical protein
MSSAFESMPVAVPGAIDASAERRVIIASSVGTIFEWYDFYLYAILAPFFASLFFPPGNQTAALLGAFGAYAAGFLVRPFGALIFGRIGDLVGRKYTFLVTIVTMGMSTVLVGFLPTYATIGFAAPLILVLLRLAQGLALGGEYGGAATYVAEHAADTKRGYTTSWIQTTATVGMLLSLVVIGLTRANMKTSGKRSKSPLRDSFLQYPNNKLVALALFGATAGQGVVWYTGQFYALFFLGLYLKLPYEQVYLLIGLSLLIGTPFFLFFGALSDRIGRLKIILAGCLIAAVTYLPIFKGLTHYVNPALESYQERTTISVQASDCNFHIFLGPWSKQSACDKAKDFLGKAGLSFKSLAAQPGTDVVTTIGGTEIRGWDQTRYQAALTATGYPAKVDLSRVNWVMTELLLVIMLIYVTMVYGPIAAFLVELFPTRIRYTSMSLPYHIGNGWFGGMLPLLATAIVATSGNIYAGLWYPIAVSIMTVIIGALFIREPRHVKIRDETF